MYETWLSSRPKAIDVIQCGNPGYEDSRTDRKEWQDSQTLFFAACFRSTQDSIVHRDKFGQSCAPRELDLQRGRGGILPIQVAQVGSETDARGVAIFENNQR